MTLQLSHFNTSHSEFVVEFKMNTHQTSPLQQNFWILRQISRQQEILSVSEAFRRTSSRRPLCISHLHAGGDLYRAGDLAAARERYYTVIELDEDHLEARTSLACVLAEQGDVELATAALEGVLKQQPDYADAHWHLAGIHTETGCRVKAQHHLLRFLSLAPESPWANLAREKLSHDSLISNNDESE